MDKANYQQTGGLPLETDTLTFIQNSYSIFNGLGAIAGEKTIIKGCTLAGNTVSDGLIYLNGEVLKFKGGLQQNTIIVREVVSLVTEFKDGTTKEVYKTRFAQFGIGVTTYNWIDFKRVYPLTSALYLDKIDMYGGDIANIPAGWYLCDGTNGTRDLRGQFIVGFNPNNTDYDTIGNTGGEESVQLTEPQLPKHTPTGATTLNGAHNHDTNSDQGMVKITGIDTIPISPDNGTNEIDIQHAYPLPNSNNHKHNLQINEIGNDEAHENRPPFYTLAFIQFKGI